MQALAVHERMEHLAFTLSGRPHCYSSVPLRNTHHAAIIKFSCWPAMWPSGLIGSIWSLQLAGDINWQCSQQLNKRFSNIKARQRPLSFLEKNYFNVHAFASIGIITSVLLNSVKERADNKIQGICKCVHSDWYRNDKV